MPSGVNQLLVLRENMTFDAQQGGPIVGSLRKQSFRRPVVWTGCWCFETTIFDFSGVDQLLVL